jgi:hypothetical protein
MEAVEAAGVFEDGSVAPLAYRFEYGPDGFRGPLHADLPAAQK